MDLTVVVLTKNESTNLPDFFRALPPGLSVLVIDSQSTDNTVSLAQASGASVIQTQHWHGFGRQRNLALQHVKTEWVLFLDADERVQDRGWTEIRQALAQGHDKQAYGFPRMTHFAGKWIKHCGWYPDHVLRLFRLGQAHYSDDLVHERVILNAGIVARFFQTPLLHYSYPSPDHYWMKMQTYSKAWAAQQHALGRTTSLSRAIASSFVAFIRSYVLRLGFLDGVSGLAVCLMQAQATYSKYFMLYWIQKSK